MWNLPAPLSWTSAHRTVRNQHVFCNPSSLWYFVIAAQTGDVQYVDPALLTDSPNLPAQGQGKALVHVLCTP